MHILYYTTVLVDLHEPSTECAFKGPGGLNENQEQQEKQKVGESKDYRRATSKGLKGMYSNIDDCCMLLGSLTWGTLVATLLLNHHI